MRTLEEIATSYERSEITVLSFREAATRIEYVLFAAAEMCPPEQQPEPRLEGALVDHARGSVQLSREILDGPRAAIEFFRSLSFSERAGPRRLQTVAGHFMEPPNEVRLIVPGHGEGRPWLARRQSSTRLCSRYADPDDARSHFGDLLREASALCVAHLGFGFDEYPEQFGAVHLFFADPLLRSMDESLTSDESSLLLTLRTRAGRSVDGCSVELADERFGGQGFILRVPITSTRMVIPIPCRPSHLRTRLFDASGELIEDGGGVFIRSIETRVGFMDRGVIRIETPDGPIEHRVESTSWDSSRGERQVDISTKVALLVRARERKQSAEASGARFFSREIGADAARGAIRELAKQVRRRCLLLDPELDADAIFHLVPVVASLSVPVRLLTSGRDASRLERVSDALARLISANPRQSVCCRVLAGDFQTRGSLIVSDDDAYILTNSVWPRDDSATAISRIPVSAANEQIAELERHWFDDALSRDLPAIRRDQEGT